MKNRQINNNLNTFSGNIINILFIFLIFTFCFNIFYPQEAFPMKAVMCSGFYLVITLLLVYMLIKTRTIIKPDKFSLLALIFFIIFIIWSWISTVTAPVPTFGYNFIGTLIQGFWLMLCMMIFNKNFDLIQIKSNPVEKSKNKTDDIFRNYSPAFLFAAGLIIIISILSIIGIYQKLYGFERQYRLLQAEQFFADKDVITNGIQFALMEKRVFATFGNPNIFAAFLACSLPLLFSLLLIFRKDKKIFSSLLISASLVIISLMFTKSRGGILTSGFSVILFLLLFIFAKKIPFNKIIILIYVIILSAMFSLFFNIKKLVPDYEKDTPAIEKEEDKAEIPSFKERLTNLTTIRERLFYIFTADKLINNSVLFGNGVGSYEVFYPKYKHPMARESKFAHNFLFQMWAEIGLVAILIFFLFIFSINKSAELIYYNSGSETEKLLYIGYISAFTGLIVSGMIEYSFYFREIFLTLCLFAGILIRISDKKSQKYNEEKSECENTINEISSCRTKSFAVNIFIFIFFLITAALFPTYIYRTSMASFYSYYGDVLIKEEMNSRAAEDYFNRAIRWSPDIPWNWSKMAMLKSSQNNIREAFEYLEKAIKLNPFSASLRATESDFYMIIKKYDDAAKSIDAAIKNYPSNSKYHFKRAMIFYEMGNKDEAISSANLAIRFSLEEKAASDYKKFIETCKNGKR